MKTDKTKKKKVKTSKKGKEKVKKEKKTGGFPKIVVLTQESDGDMKYLAVHPEDYSDINENSIVGIYSFRRVVNVEVQRKAKRTPKE